MSFLLLELLSPPIHRVAGQRSVRVLPGFSFSGWGCGLLGCQEATIGNPLCEWSRRVAQGSLPGSGSWDPAPRPRTPPPPAPGRSWLAIAVDLRKRVPECGESALGRGAICSFPIITVLSGSLGQLNPGELNSSV